MRDNVDIYLDQVIEKLTELRNKTKYTTTSIDFALMDLGDNIQRKLYMRHIADECLTYLSGLELHEINVNYIAFRYNLGVRSRSYVVTVQNDGSNKFEQSLDCRCTYVFGYTKEEIEELYASGFMTPDQFIKSLKSTEFKRSSTIKSLMIRIVDDMEFCDKDRANDWKNEHVKYRS